MRIDVSRDDDDHHDRRQILTLDLVPAGVLVTVWVGDRAWPTPWLADYLNRHARRLQMRLEGTPRADLRVWLEAVRTGKVGVIQ